MTSMPASRRARAMILAPRSCPSRPGLATTTRIFLLMGARGYPVDRHPEQQHEGAEDEERGRVAAAGLRRPDHDGAVHERVRRADVRVGARLVERVRSARALLEDARVE